MNKIKFKVLDKKKQTYLDIDSRGGQYDIWISIDNSGVYIVERENANDTVFFTDITDEVTVEFDEIKKLEEENHQLKEDYTALLQTYEACEKEYRILAKRYHELQSILFNK